MKKIILKKKQFLVIVISMLALFLTLYLLFQYREYKEEYVLLDNISFLPVNSGFYKKNEKTEIYPDWKYFQIKNVNGKQVLNKIEIKINPFFKHNIYLGIPPKIQKEVYEHGRSIMLDQKTKYNLTDEEINRFIDKSMTDQYDSNDIIIEVQDDRLKSNTKYTISLKYKKWNIFNELLAKNKNVTYTFYTNKNNGDQLEGLKTSMEFAVSSYMLFGSESVASQRKEEYETCPFMTYEEKVQKINVIKNISINYEIISVLCSYYDDTISQGEEIIVNIYSKNIEDGKKAFKEELNKLNLKENDRLRVEYKHVPKTKKELISYYENRRKDFEGYSVFSQERIDEILELLKSDNE